LSKEVNPMNEELIEKCRLTALELANAWLEACKNNNELKRLNYPEVAMDAAIRKAIPLISAEARKQERERIISEFEACFSLAPYDSEYLRLLIRDTIDTFVTGKTRKQRADEKRQALKEGSKEAE